MIGASVTVKGRFLTNPEGVRRDLMTAEEKGVARLTLEARRELTREMTAPKRKSQFWGVMGGEGDGLAVRSGNTRRSISPGGIVVRLGNRVTSAVGSPHDYVKLLNDGGVRQGWSRIPTKNAQTPAGVDINAGRSVRGLPGYALIRTMNKLWIIKNDENETHFMYLLKRNVQVRGRHIFERVKDSIQKRAVAIVGQDIAIAVEKANH